MKKIGVIIIALLVVSGCVGGEQRSPLKTSIYNPDNDKIGTATFTTLSDGLEVKLAVEGLEPGVHAVHIHEFAKCEAPDFQTAGNHFNPSQKEHGLMNTKGPHVGDLPNVEADGSGMVDVTMMLPEATLKDGQKSLLRKEGTSIILTTGPDDGMSQPAGESGNRVACGKITLDADQDETSDPTEPDKKQKEAS